jgi:hypothetical protein
MWYCLLTILFFSLAIQKKLYDMTDLKSYLVQVDWESQSGVWNTTSRVVRSKNVQGALDIVIAHAQMKEDFYRLIKGQVSQHYNEEEVS